jgi:hypothetical protein
MIDSIPPRALDQVDFRARHDRWSPRFSVFRSLKAVLQQDATNRRDLLRAGAGSALIGLLGTNAEANQPTADLAGSLGIVSASAAAQMSGRARGGKFSLLELPRVMRDEWGMTVIDLNTMSFPSFDSVSGAYVDQLRNAAADAGCVLTNLKMNQKGLDMNSRENDVRRHALDRYKRAIDIASQLGCRWARPLPGPIKPEIGIHVASYQELCDHAARRDVQMLVENFGWMQSDPSSVVDLVRRVGRNVAAGVDTGNWNSNDIRYEGLESSFPIAVTCDFKAKKLDEQGNHAAYDLKRCFDIAWAAGFRGPWCFEHANPDTPAFYREIRRLGDALRTWTHEAEQVTKR